MLIAAFSATALIVFTSPQTPFAQPRNVFFGHILSSIIAIITNNIGDILKFNLFLKASLTVSLCCFFMRLLGVYHPPGSANALGYILSNHSKEMGWMYVITCGIGAIIGIIIAVFGINLNPNAKYPLYW